jgi:hypothetical protein
MAWLWLHADERPMSSAVRRKGFGIIMGVGCNKNSGENGRLLYKSFVE